MQRIALTIAYDGRGLNGWQTQKNGNTVQDHLERALAGIAGHPVSTICAGRTDAGVHALGQVVHFDTSVKRPESAWVRGVNSQLPAQIAVLSANEVDQCFHARFGASERRYLYSLYFAPIRHPLRVGRAGWSRRTLETDRMRDAAQCLLGTHDFSAFRSAQCQAASPVRTLTAIEIESEANRLTLRFTGNAFLHHMIRNLVGALIYVADGRRDADWLADVLKSRDRALSAPTFSPDGLYFVGPRYDASFGLISPGETGFCA